MVGDIPEYESAGDARIRDVVAGLAGDIPWDAKVGTLSGGQRRRVDLVRLLIGDWDILALDEPTNHLDVRAITWLANHLKNRWRAGQGALLVVTHDRWFLDEVCTRMWEVHDRVVEPFEGGFPRTSFSASSATAWLPWPRRSGRTPCAASLPGWRAARRLAARSRSSAWTPRTS